MGSADYIKYYNKMTPKQLKEVVKQDTEEMGYEEGHSYSGTWASKNSGINFLNGVYPGEDEAEKYILDNNDKWDCVDAALVKYKAGTEAQNTRISKEQDKLTELNEALRQREKNWFVKIDSSKSKTKGCSCGKRILTSEINSFSCSCGKSYVSATDTKAFDTAKTKISKQSDKISTLINKRGGKIIEKWVVGGWCSC